MDLITQGILGSALAQSGSRTKETKLATLIGCVAGLLADTDIFIRSSQDSLLNIEYHRHFTHSIFFIPFGALIAALILWPFIKKKIEFKRLYWFSLLGYSLSGFIDACTSYGTYLLWPLSDERISFHMISIVDPVFTLALIFAVVLAYRKSQPRIALYGLLFAGLYLSMAFIQLQRAESAAEQLASERGHTPVHAITKPTMANIFLWRSVYRYENRIYADGIRVGLESRVYPGGSIEQFDPEKYANKLGLDSVLYKDMQRFSKFSDNYLAIHPQDDQIIGDMRYSIQADGIRPLWGIDFDMNKPETHAVFRMYHEYDSRHIDRFASMLFDQDID